MNTQNTDFCVCLANYYLLCCVDVVMGCVDDECSSKEQSINRHDWRLNPGLLNAILNLFGGYYEKRGQKTTFLFVPPELLYFLSYLLCQLR